jgi:hypothetical protein
MQSQLVINQERGFSRCFEPDAPHQHHDALSFPDGNTVLVNLLSEGQYARVLQLPVVRREQDVSGEAEKADAAADLRVPA